MFITARISLPRAAGGPLGGLLVLGALCSCSGPASAGNRSLQPPDAEAPTAAELLERCVEAMGGESALRAPESLRKRSRARFHPAEGEPVDAEVRYWRQGEHERLEIHPDGSPPLIQIWGPEGGREWQGEQPTGRDPAAEAGRRDHRAVLRAMAAGDASLVGSEQVEGARRWVLERTDEDDRRWRVWIDDASGLPTRVLCSESVGSRRRIQQDFLFEPRREGGRWVPARQVSTLDGVKVSETWLLEYELDATLHPRTFDLDNLYKL